MLNLTLERIERQIRNLPVEHVYVLGPDNEILFHHTDNQRARVLLQGEALLHLPGNIVTHNHPGGRSFSPTDVLLARKAGVREMRVVTGTHRYSVMPPVDGWDIISVKEFSGVLNRERGLMMARLDDQIARGRLTESIMFSMFHHRLCERIAECGIVRYSTARW